MLHASARAFESSIGGNPEFAVPPSCQQGCRFFLKHAGAAMLGPIVKIGKKQTIFEKGQAATHSYKVVEGAVRISRLLADGHRQILSIHLPNEVFGIEYAETHSATAEAVGDVVLLRCPRGCIEKFSETHIEARRHLMTLLSRESTSAQDHLVMLGHQGAKMRVAAFLMRMAELAGIKSGQTVDVPVGRQDMADYLGLTIETTCRAITDFKESGIIAVPNRHQIIVRNLGALRAVADPTN